MKKLLALLCALMLALPLLHLPAPAVPAQAETPAYAIIALTSQYGSRPTVTIEDAAFLRWLQALLTVEEPSEPLPYHPADDVYEITFYGSDVRTYIVTHDDLYNLARVQRPDGSVHTISVNVPEMLNRAVFEVLSFAIPESHRSLLQRNGWTVAFRHPHMPLQLPHTLEASRTDASALHFTWADLFLRDAGYDITPFLGQAVIPYVYSLYETMPRQAFTGREKDTVRYSLYAVVLECNGQIAGAYLFAHSWDGRDLMSLKGNAAPALLGEQTVREYLLARLPLTEAECELAALSPEEVLVRYGAVNDPMLMDIEVLLSQLGTASSMLPLPAIIPAIPTGDAITVTGLIWEGEEHTYEVRTGSGSRYPQLILESPETGWKVVSYYNTGF